MIRFLHVWKAKDQVNLSRIQSSALDPDVSLGFEASETFTFDLHLSNPEGLHATKDAAGWPWFVGSQVPKTQGKLIHQD